jgi:hypothetical protein
MAATTTLLGLVTPTQGTLTGTWGDTVNYGISDYLDIAIAGTLSFAGDGAITLANTTGSSSGNSIGATTAQYAIIKVTGTLTTAKIITGPSYSKTYLVVNAATGSTVTFKASGQTGVSIAVGETALVYYNGTDYVKVVGTATAGAAGGSTTQVQYNNAGVLAGITGATSNGTALTLVAPNLGSPASVGTMPAFTLGGTVSGGGNQINNVVIGTTTPLAGAFTTVTASTPIGTASGGTGLGGATPFTSGGVVYASSTSALATGSGLVFDGTNLGINTASPGQKLDVNGVIRCRDGAIILSIGTATKGVFLPYSSLIGSGTDYTPTIQSETGLGIAFAVNGSITKSMTFDSSGNLGVGVTSPSQKLELAGVLRVKNGNADTNGLNLSSDASGVSTINSGYAGAGVIRFLTSDDEKMRLTNGGNLGIGTSSPAARLHVTGSVNTYAGAGLLLGSAGVTSGYIWTTDSLLIKPNSAAGTASGSVYFQNFAGSNSIVLNTTVAGALTLDSSGNLLVGVATANANGGVLQLKSGITFPAADVAATDANTLDDYEEGTFTPSITATGVTAYATRIGKYTKIGQVVVINIDFVTAISTGTTGTFTISNAPFTQAGFQATASARESGLGTGFLNSVWMVGNTTTILVEGAQLVAGYGYAFTIVYQV